MQNSRFPKNFFWGASTSSHQIEGNTTNDWSEWEKLNAQRLAEEAPKAFSIRSPIWNQVESEAIDPHNYIAGVCDDNYNRWREDIELLKSLNVNAYRFSIEWSRIEPKPGVFDTAALNHYREIISELRKNNIEPFITVLHRAVPTWFAKQGGWAHGKSSIIFARYAGVLAEQFSNAVTYWMPLNEPMLNIGGGYVAGIIPPNRKNILVALKAYSNMIRAHNKAYAAIKRVNPNTLIGSAHAAVYAEPEGNHWYNRLVVRGIHYFANWKFFNGTKQSLDFIGMQYYTRGVVGFRKNKFLIPLPQEIHQSGPASDMGQEIYPEGLYKYAKLAWQRYHKPIIVTENGIADRNDTYRAQYITDHVSQVEKLIRDGVDMRGYFHWSLLDNFEWDKGFWPRFGLIEIDRKTLHRSPRPSVQTYSSIITENQTKTGK